MKKFVALALTCAIGMCMLTGCGKGDEKKEAVAFVLGSTANSMGLNLDSPLVAETAARVVLNSGFVSVVSVDGDPSLVYSESFELEPRYKHASKARRNADANARAGELLERMSSVRADDSEVDYLRALQLAARSLEPLSGYDSKSIIVVGTGLSTTGVLDFRNDLLKVPPEKIVLELERRKEIPDFNTIKVYWQQMGDTSAPESSLSGDQLDALRAIYESLVEAGKGTLIMDSTPPKEADKTATYPAVSLLGLPQAGGIGSFDPERLEEGLKEGAALTESQVGFVADEAVFIDREQASSTLEPLAEFIRKNSESKLLLCGTTAGDTDSSSSRDLSRQRAEAVREELLRMGCDPHQLVAVGLGSTDPWHIYGLASSDSACNRKVVLIDARSETAKSILRGEDQYAKP